jgi:DnaJ-class molecular chaperone
MTKLISVDSKSTDEPNIIEDDRLDLAGAMREHAVTVAAEGDEDDLETCPECDGDGCSGSYYEDGSPQPCPECRGEGVVKLPTGDIER